MMSRAERPAMASAARFDLRRMPDGVFPVADHTAIRIDDGQSVAGVDMLINYGVVRGGRELGIHVEKRELELAPLA